MQRWRTVVETSAPGVGGSLPNDPKNGHAVPQRAFGWSAYDRLSVATALAGLAAVVGALVAASLSVDEPRAAPRPTTTSTTTFPITTPTPTATTTSVRTSTSTTIPSAPDLRSIEHRVAALEALAKELETATPTAGRQNDAMEMRQKALDERIGALEAIIAPDPVKALQVQQVREDVDDLATELEDTRTDLNDDVSFSRNLTLASVGAIAIGLLSQALGRRKQATENGGRQ
ncbi:MAG TPA: hypothetical protein VF230_18215 [Acidimicrobiales bacterium]